MAPIAAPLQRVLATGLIAIGASVVSLLGFSASDQYDPFHLTGPAAAAAFFIGWVVIGGMVSRLMNLRTPLIGFLVFLPLVVVIVVRDGSARGALLAAGLGVIAGMVAYVPGHQLGVDARGNVLLVTLGLLVIVPVGAAAHVSAAEAAIDDAPRGVRIMALHVEGDRAWFLVRSNSSWQVGHGDDVTTLTLIGVKRRGLGWGRAATTEMDRTQDTRSPEGAFIMSPRQPPAYPNADYPDSPAYIDLPEACASPAVAAVPYDEVMHNCWIPDDAFLVLVAPRTAHSVEVTRSDRTEEFVLRHPPGDPAGLIIPTDRGDDVIRVAYRDEAGRLLDAVPSNRLALGWYRTVAAAAGASMCSGRFGDDSCLPIPAPGQQYNAYVSISLLTRDEAAAVCGPDVPSSEWVVVGLVQPVADYLHLDWSRTRASAPTPAARGVVMSVTTDDIGRPLLDASSAQVSLGQPCFQPRNA